VLAGLTRSVMAGLTRSVMAGFIPAIHVLLAEMPRRKTWMRGSSPRMTIERSGTKHAASWPD